MDVRDGASVDAAFRQCVARTREDGELRCAVSGPWPPYAFAGEIG